MFLAIASIATIIAGLSLGINTLHNLQNGQRGDGRKRRATSEETGRRRKKKTGRRSITPSREEEEKVELFDTRQRFYKRFNAYCYEGTLKFEKLVNFGIGSIEQLTQKAIDSFIMQYLKDSKTKERFDDVLFSLQLNHPTLKDLRKGSLYLPPRTGYQNTAFALYSLLERIMQSNESIKLDNQMTLMVTIRPTRQGGKCNPAANSFAQPKEPDNFCLPRAIARGFTLAQMENFKKTWLKEKRNRFCHKSAGYKKIRDQYELLKMDADKAKMEGIRLCKLFLSDYNENSNKTMGIPEISTFDQKLSNVCRIYVYDDQTGCTIYSSTSSNTTRPIMNLLYSEINQHYELLVTPRGFFNGVERPYLAFQCNYCGVLASQKHYHQRCAYVCLNCQEAEQCEFNIKNAITCLTCKITFGNEKCFTNHFHRNRCIARRYKCLECNHFFYSKPVPQKDHKCHQTKWCGKCQDYRGAEHKCTWDEISERRRKDIEESLTTFKYLFFDFETTVNTITPNGEIVLRDKQIPTHVVAKKICNKCCPTRLLPANVQTKGNNGALPCAQCKESSISFGPQDGDDEKSVLDRFCKWLFVEGDNNQYTAISHNGGRFDTHFILSWLLDNNINPEVIMNGQNIMSLKTVRPRREKIEKDVDVLTMERVRHKYPMLNSIKFLDSRNFLSMPLSKFSEVFEIQESKGKMALFANDSYTTESYWNHQDKTLWPSEKFYNLDQKSEKERNEILQFIEEMNISGKPFNMQREILHYCDLDVTILLEGCMTYRKTSIEASRIDPFKQCITLASTCLLTFRLNHHDAKRYPIAHLPENGYNQNQKQSMIAEKMLRWLEHDRQFAIQHKGNGGEKEVELSSGRKVRFDGFYIDCNGRKKVIDIQGDIWHGCTVCYPQRDFVNPMNGKTMDQLLQETNQRVLEIEADGYDVEQIWECEIRRMLLHNKEMKNFFDKTDIIGRLSGRGSFMGGRTQTFKMLSTVKEGEAIDYVDVNSLYPYVNCITSYPIGEPDVIFPRSVSEVCGVDRKTLQYKGLIYCKIAPPRGLAIALLPVKYRDMLVYTLCYSCMRTAVDSGENHGKTECKHTQDERCITQAYYHEELALAISNGYVMKECYEIWSWKNWTQGSQNGEIPKDNLFSDYMLKHFRAKEESSGFPPGCSTEAAKKEHMEQFERVHGIALRRDKIKNCPPLRQQSKWQINNLWGKTGQRVDLVSTSFARTMQDIDRLWYNSSIEITSDQILGDNIWLFTHKPKQETIHSVSYGNVVIAALTCSKARTILTSMLLELGIERVNYCDSDSIIYTYKTGDKIVEDFKKKYCGPNLGQLKEEVSKPWRIVKFCSPGSKQYAYITENDNGEQQHCIKLRGIQQNHGTKTFCTVENIEKQTRAMVDNVQIDPLLFKSIQIRKRLGIVSNVKMTKRYEGVNLKGQIGKDGLVLPYGY